MKAAFLALAAALAVAAYAKALPGPEDLMSRAELATVTAWRAEYSTPSAP